MRFLNLVCQGAWRGVVAAALIISAFVWATPSLAAVTTPAQRPAVVAVSPAPGQTVGVAAPVVVTFARPVVDRAAAQGAFTVTATSTPAGQFEWLNDRVLQWKPAGFWPAHSRIAVTLDGFRTDFNTGAAVVGVASISNHTFTVSIDG
jgi:lipoprotein-anchoring transpeptidase ErfK/SrfK